MAIFFKELEAFRLLDSQDRPQKELVTMRHSLIILVITILLPLATGCSIPQIVVIDDPLSAREHVDLGMTYEAQGDLDLAESEYRKACSQLPEAFLYRGNIAYQRKK